MKKCKRCELTKPYDMFTKSPSNKDGFVTVCKPCKAEQNREYGRTPKGRLSFIFASQRGSSKERGHPEPTYSRKELYEWAYQNGYEDLHTSWADSGFQKDLAPSVDRLDDSRGYSMDNIRLVTWKENNDKMYATRKAGTRITAQNKAVNQLALDGSFIKTYPSVATAGRATGIQRTNINAYCKGNKTSAHVGGFLWEYA